ncbi:hypothetical protein BOSEA31B_12971 [Hyphomicrobiales bacterium]|nr:hypothetical protein BOSEA31B_12971 [Hyphomicrobiales bacterium]CAH1698743.1 hypothetical protein BOSEA1005_11796 [Hyphomicrobiales bacterium]
MIKGCFAGADLRPDQDELADVVTTLKALIDDPAKDCDLSLDMRGAAYALKVDDAAGDRG